mmetsp:Transcript_27991/g.69882  ORF Transcript_27991/g.69882 Transcript_27991/m.69882 type:complete len:260 (-) Transcript_27991:1955-2734(-)
MTLASCLRTLSSHASACLTPLMPFLSGPSHSLRIRCTTNLANRSGIVLFIDLSFVLVLVAVAPPDDDAPLAAVSVAAVVSAAGLSSSRLSRAFWMHCSKHTLASRSRLPGSWKSQGEPRRRWKNTSVTLGVMSWMPPAVRARPPSAALTVGLPAPDASRSMPVKSAHSRTQLRQTLTHWVAVSAGHTMGGGRGVMHGPGANAVPSMIWLSVRMGFQSSSPSSATMPPSGPCSLSMSRMTFCTASVGVMSSPLSVSGLCE